MINEKPKEEKFNQEGEHFLSDNQHKIIVGFFGIGLVLTYKNYPFETKFFKGHQSCICRHIYNRKCDF